MLMGSSMDLIVSLASERNARRENQDAVGHFETPFGRVYVLADGMGGATGGRWAAETVVDRFPAFMHRAVDHGYTAREALVYTIRGINREIFRKARLQNNRMGTTVVAALAKEDGFLIAHLGDSRAYCFGAGRLTCLTRDHSAVQVWMDEGKITPEEARDHPRRSLLTRAVGVAADVEPELIDEPLRLDEGASLILCSDGLSGFVVDEDIERVVARTDDKHAIADALVAMAISAGSNDNITILAISRPGELELLAETVSNAAKPQISSRRSGRRTLLPVLAAVLLGSALGAYHLIPDADAVEVAPTRLSEIDRREDYPWQSEVCPSSLMEKAALGALPEYTAVERSAMARRFGARMEALLGDRIDTEPDWRDYLGRLGRPLAAHGRDGDRISFHYVDDDAARSFALPDGEVYVFRGMLEQVENEAQLAFILARGVSEVDRGRLPLLGSGDGVDDVPATARLLLEKETDAFALRVIVAEGYSPYQAVALVARWPESAIDPDRAGYRIESRVCALENQTVSLVAETRADAFYVGQTNLSEKVTAHEAKY